MVYYVEQSGRYTRDFVYMFEDEINIVGYVFLRGDHGAGEKGVPLCEVKAEICSDEETKLIICGRPEDISKDMIDSLGLEYQKDWIYAEELFVLLDKRHLNMFIQGRKTVLWGVGKKASELKERFSPLEFNLIVDGDRSKQGKILWGKEIHDPICLQQIKDRNEYYILIAAPYGEIKRELECWGWEEGEQFADTDTFSYVPSVLLKGILYAPSLTRWQCRYPFEHVWICSDGGYHFCSFADSTKMTLGNAGYLAYESYEQSVLLRLARLSVLNGTYVFCDRSRCSRIRDTVLLKETNEKDDSYPILKADAFPKVASVDIDSSCNLYCCSCRNEIINHRGPWQQRLTDRVIEQVLPKIDILFLAGAGEVFLSPYYRQILHAGTFKRLKGVMILSNGNICKREEWEHIARMVNGNVEVSFSVDAGTKETYEKIRRGGNFEKVEEHIRYVCGLKQKKSIRRVILNFVIQRDNYKELELFVLWGKSLGVDYFNITYLNNWGTWTEQEFKQICMYENVKKPLPELQEELDKLKKYGDCILIDDAVRYREMNYAMLMENS